jgi:SagB-type dehydrogenase family enzyme
MDDRRRVTNGSALGSCLAWLDVRPDQRVNADDESLRRLLDIGAGESGPTFRLARTLLAGRRTLDEIWSEQAAPGDGLDACLESMNPLAQAGLLRLAPNAGSDAVFEPRSLAFIAMRDDELAETVYRFSRWTFVTIGEAGETLFQSAAGTCDARIFSADLADLALRLGRGARLADALPKGHCSTGTAGFVALLIVTGLLVPADAVQAAAVPGEMLWEFHDLLFHTRSRLGRHRGEIGGTYPWAGKVAFEPALKRSPEGIATIPLARPNLGWLKLNDIPLTAAIERRKSIRTQGAIPISRDELGHFLYRTACVRSIGEADGVEFTSRPYASGGGSYELELYLCIDRCLDLERGFYYYDPHGHQLLLKRRADRDLELALHEAWQASAGACRPQVLVMAASRFRRVSWKYQGIAYATQLKNWGVLCTNMYLVAESMNLAACALGLGNATRFARLSDCDFYSEGSIGEFMLGTRAWSA